MRKGGNNEAPELIKSREKGEGTKITCFTVNILNFAIFTYIYIILILLIFPNIKKIQLMPASVEVVSVLFKAEQGHNYWNNPFHPHRYEGGAEGEDIYDVSFPPGGHCFRVICLKLVFGEIQEKTRREEVKKIYK